MFCGYSEPFADSRCLCCQWGRSCGVGGEHGFEHRGCDHGWALLWPHQQILIPRDDDSGFAISCEGYEIVVAGVAGDGSGLFGIGGVFCLLSQNIQEVVGCVGVDASTDFRPVQKHR